MNQDSFKAISWLRHYYELGFASTPISHVEIVNGPGSYPNLFEPESIYMSFGQLKQIWASNRHKNPCKDPCLGSINFIGLDMDPGD